jgi:hypothetical protein
MNTEKEEAGLYKQYEVLVCTGELSFTGTLRCDFSQRLIDALNEGVPTEGKARAVTFLPIQNVTMASAGGGEQKFQRIYIAKNNIVFVAQAFSRQAEKPLSTYPFREKLPVMVMAYSAWASDVHYTLEGRIYVDTWGQVVDTIESGEPFIPFTQVEIYPAPPGANSSFDFVALNKERIVSICESPSS